MIARLSQEFDKDLVEAPDWEGFIADMGVGSRLGRSCSVAPQGVQRGHYVQIVQTHASLLRNL